MSHMPAVTLNTPSRDNSPEVEIIGTAHRTISLFSTDNNMAEAEDRWSPPPTVMPQTPPLIATMEDLRIWKDKAQGHISRIAANRQVLMWGTTLEDTADCALAIIHHLHCKEVMGDNCPPLNLPSGSVRCRTNIPLRAFVQSQRVYQTYVFYYSTSLSN
jgi:hypothetical protein